ncbi:MAG TPA: hypothetical protein VGG34_05990 [Opitutaceae bacterium]
MNPPNTPKTAPILLCGVLLLCSVVARAAGDSGDITAVSSKASSDYKRGRLPDGSFQPEYYSFGKGGNWGGSISDSTIDKLTFLDVAHVIAEPLARQKYLPARDPKTTRLLIMVYWGTTEVPMSATEDPLYNNYQQSVAEYNSLLSQMTGAPAGVQAALNDEADSVLTAGLRQLSIANHRRDQIDFNNAAMLGYDDDGLIGTEYGKNIEHTALGTTYKDEVAEIEDNRYFVVLMAYDFQILWKQRKHKLLWQTRFSIRERDHQFDRDLPAMAQYASQYFGQNTHGLVRKQVPLGRVEIGTVKSLGVVSSEPAADKAPPPAKP